MPPHRSEQSSRQSGWAVQALALSLLSCLIALISNLAFAGPIRSLQEIRHEGVVIQKWDTSCGAAALATVLTYSFNDPVSEREVASGMLRMTMPLKVRHRGGFSFLDMKRFAELRGYKGQGYSGLTMGTLLQLESPIVPIVQYGNPHFVVVRGLDRSGRVKLADPAFGNLTMSAEDFEAVWKERIGFMVIRG
jgi:predicted double-glycine peptidase